MFRKRLLGAIAEVGERDPLGPDKDSPVEQAPSKHDYTSAAQYALDADEFNRLMVAFHALTDPIMGGGQSTVTGADKAAMQAMKDEILRITPQLHVDYHYRLEAMVETLDGILAHAEEIVEGFQNMAYAELDRMYGRFNAMVELWARFDPENDQSATKMLGRHGDYIPFFISDWKPFGTGGTIPSVVMSIRANAETGSLYLWVSNTLRDKLEQSGLLRYNRSPAHAWGVFDESQNINTVLSTLSDIETETVVELREELDKVEKKLMNFEVIFNEYFAYFNETQFLNQWFYGKIFFQGLSSLAAWVSRPFGAMAGKLVARWSMAQRAKHVTVLFYHTLKRGIAGALDDVARIGDELVFGVDEAGGYLRSLEEAYEQLQELLVANQYTPEGVSRLGVALPLPGTGRYPPDFFKRVGAQWVDDGLILGRDQWMNAFLRSFLDDAARGGLDSTFQYEALLTRAMKSLIRPEALPMLGFTDDLAMQVKWTWPESGILNSLKSVSGVAYAAGVGAYIYNTIAKNIVGPARTSVAEGDLGGDVLLGAVQGAFDDFVQREITARSQELLDSIGGGATYQLYLMDVEQRMRNNMIHSPAEVEADMQGFYDSHLPELQQAAEAMGDGIIANMTDEQIDALTEAAIKKAEENDIAVAAAEWITRAGSILAEITQLKETGAMKAAFSTLLAMNGTQPIDNIELEGGGIENLPAILERYIEIAGGIIRARDEEEKAQGR